MEELLEEAAPQAEQKEKKSWKLPRPKRTGKRRWKVAAAVVVVAAIGAAAVFGQGGPKQMGPVYRPEQVTRRDLSVKVAGTATLMGAMAVIVGQNSGMQKNALLEMDPGTGRFLPGDHADFRRNSECTL